jgi:hypothetical protein
MSTIKVDTIESKTINGDITVSSPLVGDGSGLTSLTAANLTGTIHADRYTDTVYTHPTTAGNKHIPTAGATDQVLTYSSSGTAQWAAPAAGGVDGITSSADATAITIDSSERVGIGTTSPECKVHIMKASSGGTTDGSAVCHMENSGSALLQITAGTANTAGIAFGDSGNSNIGSVYYDNSVNDMIFRTDNGEKMRITSAGNVTADTFVGEGAINGWCTFNGTGTVAIEDSFNVSSLTDSGTGYYGVNWDTNFNNASFCNAGLCKNYSGGTEYVSIANINGGASNVKTWNGSTASDKSQVFIMAIGGSV